MLLDDFTYQKSLEEKEKDKVEYYKNFELQMSALRKKLSAIESHTMYSGLLLIPSIFSKLQNLYQKAHSND